VGAGLSQLWVSRVKPDPWKRSESDLKITRFGTKEFEVTADRLGCYRPEEHIDNPKDYADNLDARQYDRRLRGPVDERRELSINPQTGKLLQTSVI
jgi:hypothetical protein